MNLPTTHGQREGSLVRPFMSKRQRKNSLPDTRSRGGEGWGEREREMGGWGRVWGNKKEGGGRGRGAVVADEEREFSWKPELLVLDIS